MFLPASLKPSATHASTGIFPPNPAPAWMAGPCTRRAAACWAAPRRSMGISGCGVRRVISTIGPRPAAAAGHRRMCCRIFVALRIIATMPIAAPAGRSMSLTSPHCIPSSRPSWRAGLNAGWRATRTIMARRRRVFSLISAASAGAAASARRAPFWRPSATAPICASSQVPWCCALRRPRGAPQASPSRATGACRRRMPRARSCWRRVPLARRIFSRSRASARRRCHRRSACRSSPTIPVSVKICRTITPCGWSIASPARSR